MDSRLSCPGAYPPLSSSSTLSLPLTLSLLVHCYPTFVMWLSLFHGSVHPSSVPALLASINLLLSFLLCTTIPCDVLLSLFLYLPPFNHPHPSFVFLASLSPSCWYSPCSSCWISVAGLGFFVGSPVKRCPPS